MAENVGAVTDSNFKAEVLEAELPVLVDFWAEWCGPCRMVAPVVEQIANENAGRCKVAKLNVDENQDTARQFGIMSIPTLMLFKGGEVAERIVGFMPKPQLMKRIEPHLG
jgi:thioredoxin 1